MNHTSLGRRLSSPPANSNRPDIAEGFYQTPMSRRPLRRLNPHPRYSVTVYSAASTMNLRAMHSAALFVTQHAPNDAMHARLREHGPNTAELQLIDDIFVAGEYIRERKRVARQERWADYDSFPAEVVILRLTETITGDGWRPVYTALRCGTALREHAAERHSGQMELLGLFEFNPTSGLYLFFRENGEVRYHTRSANGVLDTIHGASVATLLGRGHTEDQLRDLAGIPVEDDGGDHEPANQSANMDEGGGE